MPCQFRLLSINKIYRENSDKSCIKFLRAFTIWTECYVQIVHFLGIDLRPAVYQAMILQLKFTKLPMLWIIWSDSHEYGNWEDKRDFNFLSPFFDSLCLRNFIFSILFIFSGRAPIVEASVCYPESRSILSCFVPMLYFY